MDLTYKQLNMVHYPAFRLPSNNLESKDGLLYLDGQILDDRNMKGETLGIRRLQTPFKSLHPLSKACELPISIIKQAGGPYIDNLGKLFNYRKTKFCQLKYYKIKKIDRKVVASVLWLHGINFPIAIPRPPSLEYPWAGMLLLEGNPWLLYEYAREKLPSTRRKV